MIKKAIISVSSIQKGTEDNVIEVVTPGEFYHEEGYFYAKYDETEISGMEGTKTTLKISEDTFSLIRVGTTNVEMSFKKDAESIVLYGTPYGVLEMKTKTKDLKINLHENGGEIDLVYNLSIAGQTPQNTAMKINIKA